MKRVNTSGSSTGKRNKKQGGKNQAIAWHPAFIEALQLELEEYRDSLEFQTEHPLTAEPLKIDCIVIKKVPDVVINKNIAAIFRDINIIEYKSPSDYVSVADFHKVYAYAYLYSAFEDVPIDKMTISFIESHYPKKLLAYLQKERDCKVEKSEQGIYTVKGDFLPIQIIDNRMLPAEENLWLKELYNKLDQQEFRRILTEISSQKKATMIGAYLDAIIRANKEILQEDYNMTDSLSSVTNFLEEIGISAKWEAKGEARAKENEALAIARNMVDLGLPPETVISATMLDPEKVKALYQNK